MTVDVISFEKIFVWSKCEYSARIREASFAIWKYGNMGIWKYGNMGLNSPKLCYPMHWDVIQLIKEFLGRVLALGAASRCVLILTQKMG